MMKKNLWMMAAMRPLVRTMVFCGVMMLLTSCSKDDDKGSEQTQNETQQKAEMKKSLLGLQVDLSDILSGGDDVSFWNLFEDGTFEVMTMSMFDLKDSEEDSLAVDVFKGKWEVFVNAENPWDPASEKLSGFKATLQVDDEEQTEADLTPEDLTMTYYAETDEDEDGKSGLIMLNSVAMNYLIMSEYEGNDETKAMTRKFTGDIFGKRKKKVLQDINRMKESFGSTFTNIYGHDKLEGLSKDDCKRFYQDAENVLKQMMADNKATKTDYAEWMNEIYTKKGKNPRICDMNIPGTHDTFTSYFDGIMNGWVRTQLKTIEGQWAAGARVFDFRLKYNDDKDKQWVGLYHRYYLDISFEETLNKIVKLLKDHPGETCIASLALDDDNKRNEVEKTQEILKKYADAGQIVLNPTPDIRLNDCKGKMIMIYSYEFGGKRNELYGPMLLIGRGGQYSKSTLSFLNNGKDQNVTMTYQNLYEMKDGTFGSNAEFWKHKKESFETCYYEFQKYREREDVVWSWNQLNAYIGNYVTMSYSQNAEVMHPWAANFVAQHKNYPLGIITMDFIGTNEKWRSRYTNCELLPKMIIETNRYQ